MSNDELRAKLLGGAAAGMLRLFRCFWRLQTEFGDDSYASLLSGPPKIFAFWHGQQLAMPWFFRQGLSSVPDARLHVLISRNRDGRIAAEAIRGLGIESVAGSSSRGGQEAFRELVKKLEEGSHVAITPDGPKGPRGKAKLGAVRLAHLTGAPLVPIGLAASRKWQFRSWDAMFLPKPGARLVAVSQQPLKIPRETPEEGLLEWNTTLENAITRATEAAEQFAH